MAINEEKIQFCVLYSNLVIKQVYRKHEAEYYTVDIDFRYNKYDLFL